MFDMGPSGFGAISCFRSIFVPFLSLESHIISQNAAEIRQCAPDTPLKPLAIIETSLRVSSSSSGLLILEINDAVNCIRGSILPRPSPHRTNNNMAHVPMRHTTWTPPLNSRLGLAVGRSVDRSIQRTVVGGLIHVGGCYEMFH